MFSLVRALVCACVLTGLDRSAESRDSRQAAVPPRAVGDAIRRRVQHHEPGRSKIHLLDPGLAHRRSSWRGHQHTTTHQTSPTDTVLSSFESNASISFKLGRRFFQAPEQKIVSFQTLGFLGAFSHNGGGSSGGGSAETNGWSAGLFGELGAGFFVASKLSLGGIATATLSYARSRTTTSTGVRSTSWSYQGSAPALRFVATIYF